MCLATPHSHRRFRTFILAPGSWPDILLLTSHLSRLVFARLVPPPTLDIYHILSPSPSAIKGMATTCTLSSPQKRKASSDSSIDRRPTPESTYSSSHAASLASQQQPKWHDLMMRDAPAPSDYERMKRHDSAQRRIKNFIFSDNDIDWRSIPVIEDTPYNHSVLEHRQDLRCKASRQYLQEVLHTFRKPKLDDITSSDDGMVIIDGEEMVDMIG
ncbi:hypothetical protein CLAFUW4_13654 [Fulvia fulva]|nr:hypothetical protein CLAFUR4_13657 [Fulvia fulva]KAK4611356.1 hypothetical protein CLAFUR0_13661 [Fulvia fulva]WPV21967.1 hypothetical protein CLAFUW4_13654 [Fulvia fulva]WPV37142.1 hypothetical protein CLAFUW7_13662 [Fulvia fulva]